MNIREHQLALDVLKQYVQLYEQVHCNLPDLSFRFTRKELIEIMKWKYGGPALDAYDLKNMTNKELTEAIGEQSEILEYFIDTWEKRIQTSPSLSKKEVEEFFIKHGIESHYLNFKSIDLWDEYDQSNFYSLILKHGKAKKVYAIFMADVDDTELHAVTTQPSYFFDSYEEAKIELEKILEERGFAPEELKIRSLFKINQISIVMNENRKQIMKYFAGVLRTRANEKAVGSGADLSLLKYLSRKQLIEIIKNAHDGTLAKDLNLVELENRELLLQIKDEMYVLAYFVSQWCKEEVVPQKTVVSINQKNKDDGKPGTSVSK